MVWNIAEFKDKTISKASVGWILVKDGRVFCKWPLKDAEKKNRANAIPDKDWKLYECRLLMNGETFNTYESAHDAELIAQDHSTMSNFLKSKSTKRKRKRPAKFSSSESESDNESERRKVKIMENSDLKRVSSAEKTYSYIQKTSTPLENTLVESSANNSNSDGETNGDRINTNQPNNAADNISSSDSDDASSEDGDSSAENASQPGDKTSASLNNSENGSCSSSDGEPFVPSNDNSRSRYQPFSPLFSTIHGDNDESQTTDIRQELNELKRGFNAISEATKNNTVALQELKEIGMSSIAVFKDLSAEVFKCKEEIKKRNGLFTDLLHPDIEVPLNNPEHYDDVTEKLQDKRLIDNLVKYLATVHNENNEEEYVQASMKTLFTFNFFMKKVTWKIEPDRVCVKKSRIMHCWRESFKLKFGAKEPKKSDKEVNKFIHSICVRYKDSSRKAKRTDYD